MNDTILTPLMERLAKGERQAMQELFELARDPLMRFFYRLCRRTDLCEDLLQNTFMKLWLYRDSFRGSGRSKAYIYRVALNEWHGMLAKERRREERREAMEESMPDTKTRTPQERALGEEVRSRIMALVQGLPDAQREAFILHRFEGMNCREIAAVVGRSQKTVESRLRLALEKLTSRIKLMEGLA